jgi:predicted methyltransferase
VSDLRLFQSCVLASITSATTFLAACNPGKEPAAPLSASRSTEKEQLISSALDHADRFPGDSDEDEWRKPRALLEFMGIEAGMRVLDYFAASGYFSELLARSVGPAGEVIVYNNPPYARFAGEKLVKRFADNRIENAKVVTATTEELQLDDHSLDAVLFFLAYHDLYWTPPDAQRPFGDVAAVTAALYRALKPGGVVVVVDHIGPSDRNAAGMAATLHRIAPEIVKDDFAKAGFAFVAESSAWRNENDDHSKAAADPSVRLKTDRFAYKFRKPLP